MQIAATMLLTMFLAFLSTLFCAFVVRLACQIIDVASERTVIWCVTLGWVIGRSRGARIGWQFGPDEAQLIGNLIGAVLALLLLWWYLYGRNRIASSSQVK